MSEETPSTPLDPTPLLPTPQLPRPEDMRPAPPPAPPPPPPLGAVLPPPQGPPYYIAAAPPPPARSRHRFLVAIASVVALLLVAAIAIGVIFVSASILKRSTRQGGPLVVSTAVTATRGTTVFSDDFHNPSSGWTTNSLPSGTTFKYTADGYVVVAKGTLDHFADSPYPNPVPQLAIAVTATQSTDAPLGAGYGVSCWRGADTAELRYDFLVTAAGEWSVDRRDGGVLTKALILKQGTSTVRLSSNPVVVTGMCATLADQHTVRLIMFAGAQKVTDMTDSAVTLPGDGWQADIVLTSSQTHDSTVTVTHFEIRDLAR